LTMRDVETFCEKTNMSPDDWFKAFGDKAIGEGP